MVRHQAAQNAFLHNAIRRRLRSTYSEHDLCTIYGIGHDQTRPLLNQEQPQTAGSDRAPPEPDKISP